MDCGQRWDRTELWKRVRLLGNLEAGSEGIKKFQNAKRYEARSSCESRLGTQGLPQGNLHVEIVGAVPLGSMIGLYFLSHMKLAVAKRFVFLSEM